VCVCGWVNSITTFQWADVDGRGRAGQAAVQTQFFVMGGNNNTGQHNMNIYLKL